MSSFLLNTIFPFMPSFIMVLGSLCLMVYTFFRPLRLSQGVIGVSLLTLMAQIYCPSTIFFSPFHHMVTHPWIQEIQSLLLWSWVGYASILWSFERSRAENLLSHDLWLLLAFSISGMLLCLHAQHFLVLFLALELMTLPLLISPGAFPLHETSSEAALKYFILNGIGSAFFLFGASLLYGTTTSLDLTTWFNHTPEPLHEPSLLFGVGMIFFIGGLLFKVSIVPFHMWTPDLYGGVPLVLTSFYTLFPKITLGGLFIRLSADMSPFIHSYLDPSLLFLGGLSIVVGALGTWPQEHIGRLMGYSSILNSGFLLWALILPEGAFPTLVFLIGYGLSIVGLLGIWALRGFPLLFKDLENLWVRRPLHALFLTLFVLSWIGFPPLAGFWGKFQILRLLIHHHHFFWALIGILGSIFGSVYGLRILQKIWFSESSSLIEKKEITPKTLKFMLGFIGLLTLGFCIFLAVCDPWLQEAVQTLSFS